MTFFLDIQPKQNANLNLTIHLDVLISDSNREYAFDPKSLVALKALCHPHPFATARRFAHSLSWRCLYRSSLKKSLRLHEDHCKQNNKLFSPFFFRFQHKKEYVDSCWATGGMGGGNPRRDYLSWEKLASRFKDPVSFILAVPIPPPLIYCHLPGYRTADLSTLQ